MCGGANDECVSTIAAEASLCVGGGMADDLAAAVVLPRVVRPLGSEASRSVGQSVTIAALPLLALPPPTAPFPLLVVGGALFLGSDAKPL